MKSKRAKATDITKKVKDIVWERDKHRCIFCGSSQACPNVHVISRAYGGLGVEKNIVTGCLECHRKMDQSSQRATYKYVAQKYLESIYGEIEESEVRYRKWNS